MKRTITAIIKEFFIFIKEKLNIIKFKLNLDKTEIICSDKALMNTYIEIDEGVSIKPKSTIRY